MSELDRTPDGTIRKCDECSRPFRGEAWMDWCAECHAEMDRKSPLHARWACLTCNETFELGEVRLGAGAKVYDPMPCPRCNARTITPADGQVRETDEYYGEIGTRN